VPVMPKFKATPGRTCCKDHSSPVCIAVAAAVLCSPGLPVLPPTTAETVPAHHALQPQQSTNNGGWLLLLQRNMSLRGAYVVDVVTSYLYHPVGAAVCC
jgi:hypothetical protein